MDTKNYRFAALGLAQISYPAKRGFSASAPISRAVHGMAIHGLRRDKTSLSWPLLFFDEGRNWASAPHSVGIYSHVLPLSPILPAKEA